MSITARRYDAVGCTDQNRPAQQDKPDNMKSHLVPVTEQHVSELMSWFPDSAAVALWSPDNSFPFVRERFIAEAMLHRAASFMLLDQDESPVAFGQFYARHGCCHLARLVVAPNRRTEGFGAALISQLSALGMVALSTSRCSLFVLAHNEKALRLYRRLGFIEAVYPEKLPLPGCLYMIKECGVMQQSSGVPVALV